ncbi:MAG: metallophosphoesterase [Mycobacteriales bacterium]
MIFLLAATLVLAAIHTYLWYRLCASTCAHLTWLRRTGAWVLTGLAGLAIAAILAPRIDGLPLLLRRVLQWPGYLWIALVFYLVLWLLATELLRLLLRVILRRRCRSRTPGDAAEATTTRPEDGTSASPADPDRRVVLSRSMAVLAGVGAVSTVGYGAAKAFGDLDVTHVPITLTKLSSALDGFRIGMVADIHIGAYVGHSRVAQIVRIINNQQVDLVVIVGDLIEGSVAELGSAATPLRRLRSKHGTFFVTGNHEYYSGVEQWLEYLPTLGITVLGNQRVPIERDGASFELAGVNDISASMMIYGRNGSDLNRALVGRDRSRPLVLLAHQPVMFDEAAQAGVDLQLSGHTHGGQLAPFGLLVKAQQGVISGYKRRGDSQLYVTRGAGFWGPPVRVGASPEITIVQLRAPG